MDNFDTAYQQLFEGKNSKYKTAKKIASFGKHSIWLIDDTYIVQVDEANMNKGTWVIARKGVEPKTGGGLGQNFIDSVNHGIDFYNGIKSD